MQLEEKTLWSSAVMENCFRCLKALLGSQNTFSLDLWKHTSDLKIQLLLYLNNKFVSVEIFINFSMLSR